VLYAWGQGYFVLFIFFHCFFNWVTSFLLLGRSRTTGSNKNYFRVEPQTCSDHG
jgi:hypothetical protein